MLQRLPALDLTERAQQRSRAGQTLIPMSGVPILQMPEHVQAAAREAASAVFHRSPGGHLKLRKAIADNLAADRGLRVDPERELLITNGAQHGLSLVLRSLLSPGDEAVVPAPTYFFDGAIRIAGARPIYVPCREEDGWRYDIAQIEGAITPGTKVLLLCNPNNPTGYVPTESELRDLLTIAGRHGLTVVSDESYARYFYGGPPYTPQQRLKSLHPDLVTVTSLSKNYAFSSWRVGYVHAAPPLVDAVNRLLEWETVNVGDVPQAAAYAAITGPQDWLDAVFAEYKGKRDVLMRGVADAGFSAVVPDAGVFAAVNLSPLGLGGRDLENALLDVGITAIALDAFFGPGTHARFIYGGKKEDLAAVGTQLRVLAKRSSVRATAKQSS